jgi:hypothetical protein
VEKKMTGTEFFKSRTNLSLAFAGLLIASYFCLQISSCFHSAQVDSTANTQKTEATRQIGIAEQNTANANSAAHARQIEDIVREKTIEPRRRSDKALSADARLKTSRATQDYENSKNSNFNRSVSDSDLHRANCSELSDLFPGETFADCQ